MHKSAAFFGDLTGVEQRKAKKLLRENQSIHQLTSAMLKGEEPKLDNARDHANYALLKDEEYNYPGALEEYQDLSSLLTQIQQDEYNKEKREGHQARAKAGAVAGAVLGAGGLAFGLRKKKPLQLLGKHASEETKDTLEKIARSLDAKRKKQYWQMLKRLYGGTDVATEALKQSANPNIYHGTSSEAVKKILEQGLKQSGAKEGLDAYGKGIYFGDKKRAKEYGDALVRLKRPSELKDTGLLYPNVKRIGKNPLRANPRSMRQMDRDAYTYGMPKLYRNHGNKEVIVPGSGRLPLSDVHPNILTSSYASDLLQNKKVQRNFVDKKQLTEELDGIDRLRPSMREFAKNTAHSVSLKNKKAEIPVENQIAVRMSSIRPELITTASEWLDSMTK